MADAPIPPRLLKSPALLLAFGFGSGLSPKAPGTAGTLAAVLLYMPLASLPLGAYLLFLVFTFLLGVWLCDQASQALQVHDHGGIVWDEFVGFWLTMLAAPPGLLWLALGFALFRLFDIWKPFPIRQMDKNIAGGFGIMLDDVLAGVYAFVCLQLLHWYATS